MIMRLYYKWFFRKHGVEHPSRVRAFTSSLNESDNHPYRRTVMAIQYANGLTLEEVAVRHNVTRERVRQCVNKYMRMERAHRAAGLR